MDRKNAEWVRGYEDWTKKKEAVKRPQDVSDVKELKKRNPQANGHKGNSHHSVRPSQST